MGGIMVLAWGKSKYDGAAGVGGDHVNLGVHPCPGASDGLGAPLLEGAGAVGMDLDRRGVQPQNFGVDELLL